MLASAILQNTPQRIDRLREAARGGSGAFLGADRMLFAFAEVDALAAGDGSGRVQR